MIGAGIHVNGRISGEEDLHIEGRIEGSISLSETLFVAAEGIVVAEVQARDVVVSGIIVGNVTAEDSVTLNPGAKLVGDIAAPRLIIADGASFAGNVSMGGEAPPRRERPRPAARPRPTTTTSSASQASRPKPAAAPPARQPARETKEEDETVVVRPAGIRAGETDRDSAGARAASRTGTISQNKKKAPPRGRVPKPGKRRVTKSR